MDFSFEFSFVNKFQTWATALNQLLAPARYPVQNECHVNQSSFHLISMNVFFNLFSIFLYFFNIFICISERVHFWEKKCLKTYKCTTLTYSFYNLIKQSTIPMLSNQVYSKCLLRQRNFLIRFFNKRTKADEICW